MKITDYARIEAYCNSIPVYGFGSTFVYGQSPTFLSEVILQDSNNNPITKINPEKSWELKENKMGSTTPREPRSAENDDQPWSSVHLIDGDRDSFWCSQAQSKPNVEPTWIRIDLPVEQLVNSVVIAPHKEGKPAKVQVQIISGEPQAFGQGIPRNLKIKMSADGEHWDTVFVSSDFECPGMQTIEIKFDARLVKQVLIIGQELPLMNVIGHCFSISSVEVNDVFGSNLALHSRGAGVQVSSTFHGFSLDRWTHEMLWPIQYDVGFKWTRVGYDLGLFTWHYVEQEKGTLKVDERADEAITEAAAAGVNVLMTLDKGNFLYEPDSIKLDRTKDLKECYFGGCPGLFSTEEALQGYMNYIRYMVRHFKDRVACFEVYNEWWLSGSEYCKILKQALPIIRKEAPQSKIAIPMFGEFAGGMRNLQKPLLDALDEVAAEIDVITWHPFYSEDPNSQLFLTYPNWIKNIKLEAEKRGFKGEYMATEWSWTDSYPSQPAGPAQGLNPNRPYWKISEIAKAKNAARLNLIHLAHDVYSFWNETYSQHLAQWTTGLLRFPTFGSDPITPMQPEVVYYMMRTLCTIMDEANPDESLALDFSYSSYNLEWYVWHKSDGSRLIALWLKGQPTDGHQNEAITDIRIQEVQVSNVMIIDTLNGTQQRAEIHVESDDVVIPDVHIKDWPIVLHIHT